jgi:hypothetical protein
MERAARRERGTPEIDNSMHGHKEAQSNMLREPQKGTKSTKSISPSVIYLIHLCLCFLCLCFLCLFVAKSRGR